MEMKTAIALAKKYVGELYSDEQISNLGFEEVEHIIPSGLWTVTVAFSRPWNTPRTRAQEVLENLGALNTALKRTCKVVTMNDEGEILSLKDRIRSEAA